MSDRWQQILDRLEASEAASREAKQARRDEEREASQQLMQQRLDERHRRLAELGISWGKPTTGTG